MTKKKLCLCVQSLGVGGSSKVVFDLLNNWSKTDEYELYLIVFFDIIDNRYKSLLENKKIKTYFLHKKRTLDIPFMFRLRKTLKEIDPDIISTHLTCVAYLNFFVNYKKCTVYHTIHNTPESDLPSIYRRLIRKNVLKGNIKLICCHRYLKEATEKLYGVKVFAVDNGIPVNPRKPEENKKYDLLIVGRMTDVKRFDIFLKITRKILDDGIHCKSAVVGYGPEKESIIALSKELHLENNVDFFDSNQDVTELYKQSKIFVSCSTREGSPIVILEANSYGLPIIGTPVGGVPMMIKEGINGYLYDVGDVNKAALIIEKLLTSPDKLQHLSDSSYEESLKHTDKIMADEYLEIFRGQN